MQAKRMRFIIGTIRIPPKESGYRELQTWDMFYDVLFRNGSRGVIDSLQVNPEWLSIQSRTTDDLDVFYDPGDGSILQMKHWPLLDDHTL